MTDTTKRSSHDSAQDLHTKGFEVCIIGGGIAGLTLAIALNQRSVPFTIYEQASAFGEVGAGVSFTPNAVQAMKKCQPDIHDAFERVCTRNVWPSKRNVWFDFLIGYGNTSEISNDSSAFTITNSLGQNGVHRADFLAELVKLLPEGVARFGKRLQDIAEKADGRLRIHFEDGTSTDADAVIGCDGIKSSVRRVMLGRSHPSSTPSFTHKYAYRGLIAMDEAIAAIGKERAQNACMHVSMLDARDQAYTKSIRWDKMATS